MAEHSTIIMQRTCIIFSQVILITSLISLIGIFRSSSMLEVLKHLGSLLFNSTTLLFMALTLIYLKMS